MVGFAALIVIEFMDNDAHAQAKEPVELAHPFRVTLGQVIVDCNHVDAVTRESIEIYRQGRNQGFALTGFHLCDLALVQNDSANKLDVKVAHDKHAPSGFPGYSNSFRK